MFLVNEHVRLLTAPHICTEKPLTALEAIYLSGHADQ